MPTSVQLRRDSAEFLDADAAWATMDFDDFEAEERSFSNLQTVVFAAANGKSSSCGIIVSHPSQSSAC